MSASLIRIALLGMTFASGLVHADFMPDNDLWKEDNMFRAAGGISQTQFNQAIDEAESFYRPIVSRLGGNLTINRLWSDSTVNASAVQSGTSWIVNMYGGLARRPEISKDGFALVLCHELGHHLAGYPYVAGWAANEGQADYFATLSCARELWRDEKTTNASYRSTIEAIPKAACDKAWSTVDDQNLCYRVAEGGKSLANLLAALGGTRADFSTPDRSVVRATFNNHPAGQCRLDTYLSGAICYKGWNVNIIPGRDLGTRSNGIDGERDSLRQTCNMSEGFTFGYRPLCWFKPFLGTSSPNPVPTPTPVPTTNPEPTPTPEPTSPPQPDPEDPAPVPTPKPNPQPQPMPTHEPDDPNNPNPTPMPTKDPAPFPTPKPSDPKPLPSPKPFPTFPIPVPTTKPLPSPKPAPCRLPPPFCS